MNDVQRSWLTDTGSLTQRLRNYFQSSGEQNLRFCLTQQGPAVILAEEAAVLGLPASAPQWVREMAWHFKDQPIVMARTIIPLEAPSLRHLHQLGAQSIGDVLFGSGDFHPGAIQRIGDFARRRIFRGLGAQLLVVEIFLPAFFEVVS